MNKRAKGLLSLMLAAAMVIAWLPHTAVPAEAVAYENTYVNTGDQRADIIGVALTQLGYAEGTNNDTKYGTWYGMPNQPWCAMFISWCAQVADVPADVLTRTARAHPAWFKLSYKSGSSYTPKPGDLFFNKGFSHVGFVYRVEGKYFYTIEGNSNNNGSDEGTGVFSNKRLISSFYFSSPNYKGSDADHSYTLRTEQTHPHKTYYQCSDCGEKHYTGKTSFCASCSSCTACGCTASLAGTYVCTSVGTSLRIRSGHGTTYSTIGYIPPGGKVEVLAAKAGGWAHVRYEAYEGYASMEYLLQAPAAPTPSISTAALYKSDSVTLSWAKAARAASYRVLVKKDGTTLADKDVGSALSYKLTNLAPGSYTAQVRAVNKAGTSDAGSVNFKVLDTYRVVYDVQGGTGGPAEQCKKQGIDLPLSQEIPSRQGFSFLGWATQGSIVTHFPGAVLSADADITLHAVWKADSAMPQSLAVHTLPVRTMFVPEEALDTTGLTLHLTYSDGSGLPITEGFTATALTEDLGTQTVTLSYEGLSAAYEVRRVPYIPGDFNEDRFVNRDDVMYLLWSLSFPEQFPVSIPADYNEDSYVNRDDVMHLLWHLSFPEQFPLEEPV